MLAAFRLFIISILCLSLNGCFMLVTRGVGTVERALSVGDEFRSWKAQMPAIPPDRGRLIVYPGGSRSAVFEATNVGKGGDQDFVVDRDVCTVLGHSFVFLDLAPGPHEVSSDDVSALFEYRKGKNKLNIDIASSTLTYVRIDKESGGLFTRSHYFPKLVEAAVAEAELKDLPIYQDGLKCRENKAVDRTA